MGDDDRAFRSGDVEVYTRNEWDLLLSDPGETRGWIAAQDAPRLRDWR